MSLCQTRFHKWHLLLMLSALTSLSAQAELVAAQTAPATTQPTTVSTSGSESIDMPSPRKPATRPASRIVFVIDATGTMLGLKFKLVQRELTTAIRALDPAVEFTIVVFKGGDNDAEWAQPFTRVLIRASEANKTKAIEFLQRVKVQGKGTNPMPALRFAFRQKAELIYFLTDGEFNNVVTYERVIEEVARLNASRRTRLNTIALMSDDPQAEDVLRTLARDHGGSFSKITDRDLEATTQPSTAPFRP